ncbi:unnamed protein product, partial [Brassica rapa]
KLIRSKIQLDKASSLRNQKLWIGVVLSAFSVQVYFVKKSICCLGHLLAFSCD